MGKNRDLNLEKVLDRLWTDEIIFFPVRHHSPACAWHLAKLIREEKPCAILVEGPENFTKLIPFILHEETRTPFAVYTHYVYKSDSPSPSPSYQGRGIEDHTQGGKPTPDPSQEGNRHPPDPHQGGKPTPSPSREGNVARFAAYYPFCEYSPELIALREGQAVGAQLKFIDLNYPDQVQAELHEDNRWTPPRRWSPSFSYTPRVESLLQERHLQHSAYLTELAKRTGCRDTNDLWDHLFEANCQAVPTPTFIRHVATYCYMARLSTSAEELRADGIEVRERKMAFVIAAELKQIKSAGKTGKIIVVTGGFHTVALPDLVQSKLRKPKEVKISPDTSQEVLIRYSFDQLDALNGYAAGMPSPHYYQLVWEQREQAPQAVLRKIASEFLVELGRMTRQEKMQIALSTADEIAALQQAILLAEFRGHPGPMREDLLDGIRSCFVKGGMEAEGTVLLGLVHHLLSGSQIGEVPAEAGVPPIISDFRSKAQELRLNIADSTRKKITLDIYRKAGHRKISHFFHSLVFLNVSFALFEAGPDFVRGTGLDRIQERWEYCWTPRTESSLIDIAVYGSTLEEAAANILKENITKLEEEGQGRDATIAVNMLIAACRMGLQHHTSQLLTLIDEHIAEEPLFASAVQAASQLLMLWQAREPLEAHNLPEVLELMRSAYLRACYLVPSLEQCPDEQVEAVLRAFNAMRELFAGKQENWLDAEIFWEAAQRLIAQPECHSTICGGMTGLLYSEGRLGEAELKKMIHGYLGGSGGTWQQKIGFLRGMLHSCREVAWQNRELMKSVDALMDNWEEQEFMQALPEIRLAFADLTPRETDQVAELIAGFYGKKDLGELIQREISEETLHLCLKLDEIVRESIRQDRLYTLFEKGKE